MMLGSVEMCRLMALRAQRIAGRAQLRAMRLVTIRAGHSRGIHPALQERAVFVDLIAHLAIREIEIRIEERDTMGLSEHIAVLILWPKLRAA